MNEEKSRDFFKIQKPARAIYQQRDFIEPTYGKEAKLIKDIIYYPDELISPLLTQRLRIIKTHFKNVSFAKTNIEGVEFSECIFEDCLFMGSRFLDCHFTNCDFIRCNTHRLQIRQSFLDPKSFKNCLNKNLHQNIGLHLYQELLRNSKEAHQPDFSRHAQFNFRRWQRYQRRHEIDEMRKLPDTWGRRTRGKLSLIPSKLFEITLGYGTSLKRFTVTTMATLVFTSFLNYAYADFFGLEDITSIWDALYLTTIIFTSLGFGDITPSGDIGRIVISLEAIAGFSLLATLISIVSSRMST